MSEAGKEKMKKLIGQMDDIEKQFHRSDIGMVSRDVIHDVQTFQDWKQAVRLELYDMLENTNDPYIKETIDFFGEEMNGLNDSKVFSEMRARLKAIGENLDAYY